MEEMEKEVSRIGVYLEVNTGSQMVARKWPPLSKEIIKEDSQDGVQSVA